LSTFWQMPAVLGFLLQVWQAAQLGDAQQTPSTQALLAHSTEAKQTCPLGLGPQVLVGPQMLGAQQSDVLAHVATHAAPLHFAGPHVFVPVVEALQAPTPSQAFANVCVEAPTPSAQVWGAHSVPLVHSRQAPLPSQKPSVWHLVGSVLVHPADGPTGTAWQVPSEPVTAHDWQASVQTALQQKPWAQIADTHSRLAPHGCPFALSPHSPDVWLQTEGAAQSATVVGGVQLVLHARGPQLNDPHDVAAGVVHTPAPSQIEAAVDRFVAAMHVGSLQTVPAAYLWQTPAWHLPVAPQEAAPASRQIPAGSGLPVGTFVHVPSVAGSSQDWQEPPQPELQQTPCAQKVDWHSEAAEHDAPSGFLPHWLLASQTCGARQLALLVHALKHAEPLQM
jgi:hypothetical protein